MSYCEENAFTLADLPSDIIREIIRMELKDSFESMRLISQRWNCIGIDYLRDRNCLPAIDYSCLFVEADGETTYNFNMRIPNECLTFIGLQNCEPDLYLSDFSKSVIAFYRVFEAPLTKKWFLNRTSLLFNRCSRIDKFIFFGIDIDKKELKLDTIMHVFGDIAIREFSISAFYNLSALLERNIVKIVRALSVHRLILTIGVRYNQPPITVYTSQFHLLISILPEVLRVVDEVDLTSSYDRPINWDEAVAREEWTNYAAHLSEKANVSVMFKMQRKNARISVTLTARKHAEH